MTSTPRGRRTGFIGAGFIADYHGHAMRTLGSAQLAWIADEDGRRAEALRQKWGFQRAGTSAAELLAHSPPDVVHVLLPPPLHAWATEMCIRAGSHVLVEKPLATTYADSQAIVELARSRGVTIGVNHTALFQPAFISLVRRIRRGDLGEVQHVTACWNMPLPQLDARLYDHWMFAEPHNILLEQAVHPLSQVQFLLGSIDGVSAQTVATTPLPTGARFFDQWQVSLICARGTAQCYLGFGRGFCDHWLHVIGEDGALLADLRRNTLRMTTKTRYIEPVDNLVDGWRAGVTLLRHGVTDFAAYAAAFLKLRGRQDPFYRSIAGGIEAFYDALDRKTEPPVTARFAAALVKTCEEIAAAAHGERGADSLVRAD
jgi:predicted dehydrogenase